MNIQFKSVAFNTKHYVGAVVEGSTVIIATEKGEFVVEYNTPAEAEQGLGELVDALNAAESSSVVDLLQDAVGSVAGLFSGFGTKSVFGKAKTKVQSGTSTFEDFVNQVLSEVQAAEQAQATRQTTRTEAPTARSSAQEAHDTFGRSAPVANVNAVIRDLSDADLRSVIDVKVADLIENDARVIELVRDLRRTASAAEVEEVIAARKQQLFSIARQNDSLTISEVIRHVLG